MSSAEQIAAFYGRCDTVAMQACTCTTKQTNTDMEISTSLDEEGPAYTYAANDRFSIYHHIAMYDYQIASIL